jgi:hypothetical protein
MRIPDRLAHIARIAAALGLTVILGGCNLGNKSDSNGAVVAAVLAITGTPTTSVAPGQPYAFQPTVVSADSSTISFSITNKPRWLTLDTTSGHLSGLPGSADVGVYPEIELSVHNVNGSAALPKFAIAVRAIAGGSATVTIAGTPPRTVSVGSTYSFAPVARDTSGGRLTFSVQNLPAWASFEPATGLISGTPNAADVGSYSNIVVAATDGVSSASLAAFSLTVTPAGSGTGSATLSWTSPATNADGSMLTDLAGFRIYYGNSPDSLTQSITIPTVGMTTFVIGNLSSGTWYFALRAYNLAQIESALSAVVSKTI